MGDSAEHYGSYQYESAWVRRKLGLPADATTGDLQGKLHIVCAHSHGYETYIKSYKCDDKQGEIARLTAERDRLRAAARAFVDWENGLLVAHEGIRQQGNGMRAALAGETPDSTCGPVIESCEAN